MTAQPADDWQQNADVALMQLQRLERSEQSSTEEQYRSDSVALPTVNSVRLDAQLVVKSPSDWCLLSYSASLTTVTL